MTARERIEAVLRGKLPDRPPFSFWYHFPHDQLSGRAAVEAHLNAYRRYGLDFIKVMNDHPYPHPVLRAPEELQHIRVLNGTEEGFGRQIELIRELRREVGDSVHLVTTIFNAWSTLRSLIQRPEQHLPPVLDAADDPPSRWIVQAYERFPDLVAEALDNIAQTLGAFAASCISAGADGIFMSVRDDWVDSGGANLYQNLVRPTDLKIVGHASAGSFNILHVCGRAMNFRAFAEYPVQAINWADRAAGPSISDVRDWLRPTICCGVDNLETLPNGTPQDVAAEAGEAIKAASPRPMIVSPGAPSILTWCRRRISTPWP